MSLVVWLLCILTPTSVLLQDVTWLIIFYFFIIMYLCKKEWMIVFIRWRFHWPQVFQKKKQSLYTLYEYPRPHHLTFGTQTSATFPKRRTMTLSSYEQRIREIDMSFSSFPGSIELKRPLMSFANCLDQNEGQQNVDPCLGSRLFDTKSFPQCSHNWPQLSELWHRGLYLSGGF